ncbi:MAG TPA: hypothetical protein V6D26_05790 [Stenomitos sp.]
MALTLAQVAAAKSVPDSAGISRKLDRGEVSNGSRSLGAGASQMKGESNCMPRQVEQRNSEPMVVITVHLAKNTCTSTLDTLQEYMIASWPYKTLRTGAIAKSGSIIVQAFAKVISN